MPRFRMFVAGFVLVLAGSQLPAADIYVDNLLGDDSFNGERPSSLGYGVGPVRTLGRALQLAHRSDRIVLAKNEQPYRESVSLTGSHNSGTELAPFIVEGNGATLDGSVEIPATSWEHVRDEYFRFRPRMPGPNQMLFFENGRPMPRVFNATGKVPELQPLQWAVRDEWIYVRTEPGILPDLYRFSYATHDVGITLYGVHNVVVHNLVIQGFRIDGVQASDNVRQATLSGLTLRGNGRSGAAVQGSSQVELAGCLAGSNAEAQVIAADYSRTLLLNCDLVTLPGETSPALKQGKQATVSQETTAEPAGAQQPENAP